MGLSWSLSQAEGQWGFGLSLPRLEPACIVRDVLLWHCVVRSHGWNLLSRRTVTNSVAEAAKMA